MDHSHGTRGKDDHSRDSDQFSLQASLEDYYVSALRLVRGMERPDCPEIPEEDDGTPSLTATLSATSSSSISAENNRYRNFPSPNLRLWSRAHEPLVFEDSVLPGLSPSGDILFDREAALDFPLGSFLLDPDASAFGFDLYSCPDEVPLPEDGTIKPPLDIQEGNENSGYASTYLPTLCSDQTELNAMEDLHTSRRKGNMLVSIPEASAAELEYEQQYIVGLASEMQRRLLSD
ncbi:hypothetical protein BDP67DRAFT_530503 [Colletotrichum lupini]|nr:hypothetical protein BDP67DRAFT_530503 [Colletotrichum lupini]